MNFNFSKKPEYKLYTSVNRELIDLYGVLCKFVIAKRMLETELGDYAYLKTDKDHIFEVSMLPQNSESFDTGGYAFNEFNFNSVDVMNMYVSADVMNDIVPMKEIVGNLVTLPSGKVMEVTNVDFMVPHVNNAFTETADKSVYMLTMKPYEFRLHDEIQDRHVASDVKLEIPESAVVGQVETPLYKTTETKDTLSAEDRKSLEELTLENYKALDSYMETLVAEQEHQEEIAKPVYVTKSKDKFHGL